MIRQYIAALAKSDEEALRDLVLPGLEPDAEIANRLQSHGGPDWTASDITYSGEFDHYQVRIVFRSKSGAVIEDKVGVQDDDPSGGSWYLLLGRTAEPIPSPLET